MKINNEKKKKENRGAGVQDERHFIYKTRIRYTNKRNVYPTCPNTEGGGVIMLQNRRFLPISTSISHNTKFVKFILNGTRRMKIYI